MHYFILLILSFFCLSNSFAMNNDTDSDNAPQEMITLVDNPGWYIINWSGLATNDGPIDKNLYILLSLNNKKIMKRKYTIPANSKLPIKGKTQLLLERMDVIELEVENSSKVILTGPFFSVELLSLKTKL